MHHASPISNQTRPPAGHILAPCPMRKKKKKRKKERKNRKEKQAKDPIQDNRKRKAKRKIPKRTGRVLGKSSSGWHDSSTGAARLRKGYRTERMLLGRSLGLGESAGMKRKLLAVVLLLVLGLLLAVAL